MSEYHDHDTTSFATSVVAIYLVFCSHDVTKLVGVVYKPVT